jgi:hypothetical protein
MLYQYDDNCSDELLLAINPKTKIIINNIRITHLEYVEDHIVSLPSFRFPHPVPVTEAIVGR